MKLNYKEYGQGPSIIILHGLLGSSDNWMSIAKKLSEEYRVFCLDQRNHGDSPWSEEWNYEVMAEDVREFILDHDLEEVCLIGHSMGGKVAMRYAAQYSSDARLKKLAVVDMAPKAYPVHHDHILAALLKIDLEEIESRREADEALSADFSERGLRQFLLKNLKREAEGTFAWRANLKVIEQNLAIVGEAFPADAKVELSTLFIRGTNSDYIQEEDRDILKRFFPQSGLVSIEKAGHWVHAEQPKAFLEQVEKFLKA